MKMVDYLFKKACYILCTEIPLYVYSVMFAAFVAMFAASAVCLRKTILI